MRKRLQIALMASTVAATSLFSLGPQLRAADGDGSSEKITATDEHGRKIYVNDSAAMSPARHTQEAQTPRRTLMYWSSKDNRWKPVPPPNAAAMRAARSAAAEVNQYVGRESNQSANAKIVAANFSNTLTTATTGADIDSAIEQAAARHNVDPNLVRAVVKVESNFNPNALSRKGAMGLMQLMPSTARQLNVKNPFDPEQNVDAGVRHLKQLLESYGGDVKLTLAAYNAGAGAVARSSGVPRYAETQNYVRRITDLYYGGSAFGRSGVAHDPVRIHRDARGVLYISNTD
ncbi:MAG TPA: lytic transglycosylase domain-containing protein [Candidatus Polarisedimenticolia bacterium]|nr:lytic transglycosylase domain-containing protein [Candidatus Polarisedimenticolia bacterium]